MLKFVLSFIASYLLLGCSELSPKEAAAVDSVAEGLSGDEIFALTFNQHGGESLSQLNDVNVAIDGKWYFLITRIQPDLTDEKYRQQSQERLLLRPALYTSHYQGDAGTKQVLWYQRNILASYGNQVVEDPHKLAATALTADSFYLFTLGPLALPERVVKWQRLDDATQDGAEYYRINGRLTPGVGLSEIDYITLWINKKTNLTYRLHFTLDGFEPTKGAHIDTTYRDYRKIEAFTLPTHFFERVRAPVKLDVHEWWYTGLDINRGLTPEDLRFNIWSDTASEPAMGLHKAEN